MKKAGLQNSVLTLRHAQDKPNPIRSIYARVSKHTSTGLSASHHCKAQRLQKCMDVDTAGIEGKKMSLQFDKLTASPGEVFITTSWYDREVSRGHSTQKKRGVENCIGLTIGEELNAILSEIRSGTEISVAFS